MHHYTLVRYRTVKPVFTPSINFRDNQKNATPLRPCVRTAILPSRYENLLRRLSARPLILCVEDDSSALALRKAILEKNGFDVIGVATDDEALVTLREAPVCATISDHMLSGTTGTKLAAEMKKIKPDVPIILHSGTVPEHLDCIDVFISKTEKVPEFVRIVQNVVERFCS
jgi:CheY-like chemotaxis protein